MAYANTHRHTGLTFRARLHEIAGQWREARTARRVFNRTFMELDGLSGRELADLGIDRSEIRSIALDAAYGKAR